MVGSLMNSDLPPHPSIGSDMQQQFRTPPNLTNLLYPVYRISLIERRGRGGMALFSGAAIRGSGWF